MAHFRLLIIAFVATCWYASLIDTRVLKPQDLQDRLMKMAEDNRKLRIQRDADNSSKEIRYCYNTPCGWAVYVPFSRTVEYFMKNTCQCENDTYKCIRTDDDLSVSAYVYHCRQNTTSDDIESPEDAN